MLIFYKTEELCGEAGWLWEQGYGYSVLGEPSVPPRSAYNLKAYIRMFNDWTWGAATPRPAWITDEEIPYEDDDESI